MQFVFRPGAIFWSATGRFTAMLTLVLAFGVVGTVHTLAANRASSAPTASPAPSSHTASPTSWHVEDKVSALDNSRSYSAILRSSNTVRNSIGADDWAQLIIRCQQGALEMYVAWPTFLGTDTAGVHYKLDQGPIMEQTWGISTDGTATFAPDARSFIGQLRASQKFVLQASPYESMPTEAVFDLSGIDKIADSALSACPGK